MGASDLPLAVRQRIESRWSQQIKRQQQQQQQALKAALPSRAAGAGDREPVAIGELDERAMT